MDFSFTLWDVEHGLAIWIQTPSGQDHCIDAGFNSDTDFCPYRHMRHVHSIGSIDLLIISHPDKDHIEGLPSMVNYLGKPSVLIRNSSLPDDMKYGNCALEYQKIFKDIDTSYTGTIDYSSSPKNPSINGGVFIDTFMNTYCDGMKCNDTSILAIYKYKGWAFVLPGDIEPSGWKKLMTLYRNELLATIENNTVILVAPHHGRPSAYNPEMVDLINPDLVLISDKYGKHETAMQYYSCAKGISYDGETIKSLSTKTKGRLRFTIDNFGDATFFCD